MKGLDEKFSHSKSQIMMMNPLPNIDKALYLVIQQERELNYSNSIESLKASITDLHINTHGNYKGTPFTKGKGYNSSAKGGNQVCTHYGRTKHIVDTCFLKHEYPPAGFREITKNSYNGKSYSQAKVNNTHTTNPTKGSSTSAFGFT